MKVFFGIIVAMMLGAALVGPAQAQQNNYDPDCLTGIPQLDWRCYH